MTGQVYVIDDFLNIEYQKGILGVLMSDDAFQGHLFPWYYTEDVTDAGGWDSQHRAALVHEYVGLDNDDDPTGKVISGFHNMFIPMLKEVIERINLKQEETEILQGRSFLQLPRNIKREDVDTPHIDIFNRKHLVALYYVCDSDGDTIIYNERVKSKTYTVKQRVTPKEGRMVIFDGGLYHTAEQPIHSSRCVVNYNLGCGLTLDDLARIYKTPK